MARRIVGARGLPGREGIINIAVKSEGGGASNPCGRKSGRGVCQQWLKSGF